MTLFLSAFAISFLAAAIPGPVIAWIAAMSANWGWRTVASCVLGIATGTAVIILISFFAVKGIELEGTRTEANLRWVGIAVMTVSGLYLMLMSRTELVSEKLPRAASWLTGFLLSISSPPHILVAATLLSEASRQNAVLPVSLAIIIGDSLPMLGAAICGKVLPFSRKLMLRLAAAAMLGFAGTATMSMV